MPRESLKGKKISSTFQIIGCYPTSNGRQAVHVRDMSSPDDKPIVISVFQQEPPKCIQFVGDVLVLNDVDAKVKVTSIDGEVTEELRRNITGAILTAKDQVTAISI